MDAFELRAVDYVMKPVRPSRVAEAVAARLCPPPRRPGGRRRERAGRARRRHPVRPAVLRCGSSRRRATTRACTSPAGATWCGCPWPRWSSAGPTSRGSTAAPWWPSRHVHELRMDDGHCTVRLDDVELAVSRRHTRELRDRLVHRGRPDDRADPDHPPAHDGRPARAAPPAGPGDRRAHGARRAVPGVAAAQPAADGVRRLAATIGLLLALAVAVAGFAGGARSPCSGSSCRGSWSAARSIRP